METASSGSSTSTLKTHLKRIEIFDKHFVEMHFWRAHFLIKLKKIKIDSPAFLSKVCHSAKNTKVFCRTLKKMKIADKN